MPDWSFFGISKCGKRLLITYLTMSNTGWAESMLKLKLNSCRKKNRQILGIAPRTVSYKRNDTYYLFKAKPPKFMSETKKQSVCNIENSNYTVLQNYAHTASEQISTKPKLFIIIEDSFSNGLPV